MALVDFGAHHVKNSGSKEFPLKIDHIISFLYTDNYNIYCLFPMNRHYANYFIFNIEISLFYTFQYLFNWDSATAPEPSSQLLDTTYYNRED